MEEIVKQIADKLGIDEERAGGIAGVLHGDGHDLQSLLDDGDFLGKAQQLLGTQGQHFLEGIPGVGGVLSGVFGGAAPPEPDATLEAEPPFAEPGSKAEAE